jgi:transposase
MTVYVGMDVHRKRSQVAIVDAAGVPSATATWPTTRPSWCRSWVRCRRAPRSPSRPPTAGGGWSSCWRSWSWSRTWSIPAAAKQSPQPGCRNDKVDAATLAQLLRADLLPEAWIAPQQVRDLRALLRHRASLVRLSTGLKNRVHAVLADRGISARSSLWTAPGRAWLAALDLPPIPGAIIQDCCGLLDCPGHPDRPAGGRDRGPGQARPPGPGAHGPARGRPADGPDPGRRDRRHQPVPDRPQAVCLGWADSSGA